MPTDQVSSGLLQLEIDPSTKVSVSSATTGVEIQPQHKIGVSSAIIQIELNTPPKQKNVTANTVEVLAEPDTAKIRATENGVEVLEMIDEAKIRTTEIAIEVLIPQPPITTISALNTQVEYEISNPDVVISSIGTQVEAIPTYRLISSLATSTEYTLTSVERYISSIGVQVEYVPEIEIRSVLQKKYMISVADVYGYDIETGDILFVGKTLLDSSMDFTTNMIDSYSGRGEAVSNIYYDSPEMTIEISDVQFSLNLLSENVGSEINTGVNVYEEENVILGLGGIGTVTKTPVSTVDGNSVYGWVTLTNGVVEKVTFSGNNFTCTGSKDDCVSIRYYAYSTASRTIDINSEILPTTLRLVLETQLSVSDMFFTNYAMGLAQIIIPKAILSGNFSFSLTPDGVSSTPLTARALATIPEGTSGVTDLIYAQIVELSNNLNWYADVIALSVVGGDISMSVSENKFLNIRAIPNSGSAFKPQYEDIIFTSSNPLIASINTSGIITANSNGTALITATIEEKRNINTSIVVTVS